MDFKTLNPAEAADQGRWMTVKHPITGEATNTRILLAGSDSQRFLRASREFQDKRLQKMVQKGSQSLKAKEMERKGIELLAAVTIDWEGVEWDGVPLSCSEANAITLFTKVAWLREQVDAFVGDRKNYFDAAEEIDEAADEYEQQSLIKPPEAAIPEIEQNL